MTKIRSAYSRSTPIPLSMQLNRQSLPSRSAARRTTGGSAPWNLTALAIRFPNSETSSVRSPRTARQRAGRDRRPALPQQAARARRWPRRATSSSSTVRARLAAAADAREGEQVVDERLHALGAVDRELDVLVCTLVELALRSGAGAPGRSSRSCAAAPAGRARRRTRTARGRRWIACSSSACASSCVRASSTSASSVTMRSRIDSISPPSSMISRAPPLTDTGCSKEPAATRRVSRPSAASGLVMMLRNSRPAPSRLPRISAAAISREVCRSAASSLSFLRAFESLVFRSPCRRSSGTLTASNSRLPVRLCAIGRVRPLRRRCRVGATKPSCHACARARTLVEVTRQRRPAGRPQAFEFPVGERLGIASRFVGLEGFGVGADDVAAYAGLLVDKGVFEAERGEQGRLHVVQDDFSLVVEPVVGEERKTDARHCEQEQDADRQPQPLPHTQAGSRSRRGPGDAHPVDGL